MSNLGECVHMPKCTYTIDYSQTSPPTTHTPHTHTHHTHTSHTHTHTTHTHTHTHHTHTPRHTHTAPLLGDDSSSKISDSYIVAFKDDLTDEQGDLIMSGLL